MGYSQSSLAVRGKPKETVLAELRLRPTGKREDFAESPLVSAQLPSGWFIVVAQRTYPRMIGDSALRRLSAGCEIITCGVEEHVMVSDATLWRAGKCVWRVSHDATHGVENLHVEGDLPPAFASIRDRLFDEQRGPASSEFPADYIFDIPVELA